MEIINTLLDFTNIEFIFPIQNEFSSNVLETLWTKLKMKQGTPE